ncbi:hypothetical protein ACOMHN_034022 [Nucella lapillus]
MLKNNKKRGAQKKGAGAGGGSHPPTDEENSTGGGDNWSTASVISDNSSVYDQWETPGEEQPQQDDNSKQENFEFRMCEIIDGLSAKSGPQRKKSLEALKQGLCKKYCPEFLQRRKETVTDSLLRCLKKGKGEEQTLAVGCLALMALQLGGEITDVYSDIQDALAFFLADKTASVQTRAKCASTMALCCFINTLFDQDAHELSERMGLMEAMFRACCRGDANNDSAPAPVQSAQMSELTVSCLDAWSLLLTRASQYLVRDKAQTHISLLRDLLPNSDIELRIAAGEAIALVYDLNRCIDKDFECGVDGTEMLYVQLKKLSTENSKRKSHNALRQQRSRFRDILQCVQEGIVEEVTVKTGKLELLMLDDWSSKVQYKALCGALTSGMLTHLQENLMLRDFFDLGAPIVHGEKQINKLSKVQRRYFNSQTQKARDVSRAKNRDKRSAVAGYY